jgi:hypothetical protein
MQRTSKLAADSQAVSPTGRMLSMTEISAIHEWDTLWDHSLVAIAQRFGPVSDRLHTVNVYRGEGYELHGRLTHGHYSFDKLNGTLKAGELTDGHPVEAVLGEQETLSLHGVVATRNTLTLPEDGTSNACADLHCHRASRRYGEATPDLLLEWCLSGPKSTLHRISGRNPAGAGRKVRGAQLEGYKGGWRRDHVILNLDKGLQVTLVSVPDSLGPDWSTNVCLEYHGESASVDKDTRRALLEGISLFFGRRLLSIGTSAFSSTFAPISHEYYSPEADARSLSKESDHRLFAGDPFALEEELSSFLLGYLRRRGEFNLSLALRTLWVANTLPLGPDLAVMGAALERIMNAWYKSSGSRSGGVNLPKKDFEALLAPELESAAKKLNLLPNGDRVLRRLTGCYNMGANERLRNFFTELELPLSEQELDALKSRNHSAHGASGSEVSRALLLTRTYRCLIGRVVLCLLGHEGQYTDYSTSGWPERPLRVPCGGTVAG